jgi:transposase
MTSSRKKRDMETVEVITSVERRRHWTGKEKKRIVEEAEQPGMSVSFVARKYGIHPNQLFSWRKLVHEGAFTAVRAGEEVVPLSELKELRAQVRELQRLLGKKTMENEILKDAVRIAREKKLISRVPLLERDDTR